MNQRQGVFKTEDWWAVWIGLFIFLLSLGVFVKMDLLGWVAKPAMWVELGKAFGPVSKGYAGMSGLMSLFLTYISFIVIFGIGAKAIGLRMKQFFLGFTVIFILTYLCILIGNYANIAVNNPADYKKFGITWSLKLTGEAGLIIALIVGLCISNLMPRFTESLKEAARPEWYIKTAIVILGAAIGVKAVGAMGLATAVMFRGFCAIIEAYLIYWALVYFISRKYFGFSREWAAPLASGISICGVSAAIATGAAIRARPVIPIMVSSLVVIFAVVELIFLPFVAQYFLYDQPLVAGGWMGLAVKTDGAAVASGAIVDSLIRAKALTAQGINFEAGWILSTTTTVKVFIDIFIGVWAFILALVWCYAIDRRPGETVKAIEIWERFPKFIIGYILTFVIMLYVALKVPGAMDTAKAASGEADIFRSAFFALTFLSIGLVTNFRKLWEEGIGKLALVYVVCLFGFIIWIGLAISWIFFHGMTPPIIPA
ncbi:MAG TPA: putative sulfate exporter family transporter [Syntrophales bacterium]|nr:putative sulfate exporter family transporter [Syntrophales bacterium]